MYLLEDINQRHADSHDVLANYNLVNDVIELSRTSAAVTEFFELLQSRHANLMHACPENRGV